MSAGMPLNLYVRVAAAGTLAMGLSCCAIGMSACATGEEFSGPLPSPDGARFVTDVYPLLLRDCGFSGCHGMPERFFRIVGPGRARLDPKTKPDDPATFAEVLQTYQRALSMLASSKNVEDSLLLRKPLELGAGGQGHKGVDDLGRNVFPSVTDPGFVLLRSWASTRGAPPTAAQVEAAVAAAAASGAAEDSP
jgi:hypothetical protein